MRYFRLLPTLFPLVMVAACGEDEPPTALSSFRTPRHTDLCIVSPTTHSSDAQGRTLQ